MEISKICKYITSRIDSASLNVDNYISTENMMQNRGGVISASKVPKENAIEFKPGDILVSNIRPYFKKIWFADRYGGCSSDVLCIRALEGTDSVYLYYLLSQDTFFDHVMSGAKGCKMPRGDKNQIMRWEVDLPDIKEQKRIGQMLKSIDDKILLNNQINHNLEEQAQALYKSWFVDFEPFRGGNFVDSELGLIPEGWRVGTLSEISSITMGQSPSGTSFNEVGDGIVFYQGRTEFGSRFPSIRLYTTEPARFAEKFSVLLSVRAPVGDINIAKEKCCIGRGLASIHGLFQSFVYYTVGSLKPVLNRFNGEGTVFGSINRKELEGLKIIVPPAIIQEDFNSIVSIYDRDIYDRCSENETLCQLRDKMLPKLMSGELKINDLTC